MIKTIGVINIIEDGLKNVGVSGGGSMIIFCLIFKILFGILLSHYGVAWTSILLINVFILALFYLFGWIPFYVVLIILLISSGLVYVNINRR